MPTPKNKKTSSTPQTAVAVIPPQSKLKDVLDALTDGKSIRRLAWPEDEYGVMRAGFLHIYRNGEFHIWKVGDGDLLGLDWVIL